MRFVLLIILFAAPLVAQQSFEFTAHRVFTKPADVEHTCLHVTWDDPEPLEIETIEIFLVEKWWPEKLPQIIPDWRERLIADDFDSEQWINDGGPRLERFRIDVEENRAPVGFIDQRASYPYYYVEVLLVDTGGNRINVENFKGEVLPGGKLRDDVYYLPTYVPKVGLQRVWDREPSKFEWELPELGGGEYEITRVIFVGLDKVTANTRIEGLEGKLDAFLKGEDPKCRPLVMELDAEATGAWHESPLPFYYPWVLAETKSGLRFNCKLKKLGQGNDYVAHAGEEDRKALTKLELKKTGKPDDED